MRILFFNWVDFLDFGLRGGGVSFYQANLVQALSEDPNYHVTFISSGSAYSPRGGKPRWKRVTQGQHKEPAPRFEIVNSGVQAPSHHSFFNPAQVSHRETAEVFFDFIEKNGPFDVVHFNNLEGLPAEVLELKQRFPHTRVILSLHNYYPFCPQVNLWAEDRENCVDYENGRHCAVCLVGAPREHSERRIKMVAYALETVGLHRDDKIVKLMRRSFIKTAVAAKKTLTALRSLPRKSPAKGASAPKGPLGAPLRSTGRASHFAKRRGRMLDLINANCDAVLGVSGRVCEVAQKFGVKPEILHTSYIGTAQAAMWHRTKRRKSILADDGTLTLGYLGYMRRDKGYFFLMKALRALPPELASRVRLVAAAKSQPGDRRGMELLEVLSGHLKEVYHVDGYGHDELDALLAKVDVGVVPVLWEDNLPQVAIEMHARHIPLLTANLGGAHELAACPEMVFEADSVESFRERIEAILDGRISMDHYFKNALTPVSMQEHIAELRGYYSAS